MPAISGVAGVLPGGQAIPLSPGCPSAPQEALDTARAVHLTGLGHEPGD